VRLVFEPRSRTVEQAELITLLLAHTSLEGSLPMNLTMVGLDGRPTQKSLRQMLVEWLAFRQTTVHRRSRHRLQRVLDRIHVLEGRQLVLLNIDEVIRIIRHSDEPKPALIERFALSEVQADDILDIRLRQLARLEAIRIEQELQRLRDDQDKLQNILASPAVLKRTLIKEIEADVRQHGDARRTLVQEERRAVAEVRVLDEPVTVVVSLKGWVRALKGHDLDPATLAFKAGDALYGAFGCRSVDSLLVFGSAQQGSSRVYSVGVSALPGGRGDGAPITSLIDVDAGTRPAHYFAGALDTLLLLVNSGGFGLLARVGDMLARNRGGKSFLDLDDRDQLLPPAVVAAGHTQVGCLTLSGRLLVFGLDELKHQPKGGKGLTLIDVDTKDPLLSVASFEQVLCVQGLGRGGKDKDERLGPAALLPHAGKRARKGRKLDGFPKPRRLGAG
jgi:topoisomerase-4 subunit A